MRRLAVTLALLCTAFAITNAQESGGTQPYDIGAPVLAEIYVDAASGSDDNDGTTPETAYATLDFAWRQIPAGVELETGYRINLAAGDYPADNVPNYMESRYGSAAHPVMIEGSVGDTLLAPLNIYDVRYLYLIGLTIVGNGGDILHCERCDHFLLRDSTVMDDPADGIGAHETVKINQSQHIYIENSFIGFADDNAVDFVAVQYGHIIDSAVSGAQDWCVYAKGGSAYIIIERNMISGCGTGGFTAGQGTGFQFMTPPWTHYEAYDIRFVNNVIHTVEGAAFGVQGGYNILIAYNTAYNVGSRSHLLEVGFGMRSCDGNESDETFARCGEYLAAGGWGDTRVADGENFTRIPNRHVFILNNLLLNRDVVSAWQHLQIFAPYTGAFNDGSNVPFPALADDDLIIAGNIIWNGPPDHPLGIEDGTGCAPEHLTCSAAQLLRDNLVNAVDFEFSGDELWRFDLSREPALAQMPDFAWDLPYPEVPEGALSNAVTTDFYGNVRAGNDKPGAVIAAR